MNLKLGAPMVILWLACTRALEPEVVSTPKARVLALEKHTDPQALGILDASKYRVASTFDGSYLFSLLSADPKAEIAFSYSSLKDGSVSYQWLHVPTGTFKKGKQKKTPEELFTQFNIEEISSKEVTTAYAAAPWFSGTGLEAHRLLVHLDAYFYRLEAFENIEAYAHKDLQIYKSKRTDAFLSMVGSVFPKLQCTPMFEHSYRCAFPELDMSCVRKSRRWLNHLFALPLSPSPTTEGGLFRTLQDADMGICVPSGCYWCRNGGCSPQPRKGDASITWGQNEWFICAEQNLDDDEAVSRVCFSNQDFTRKKVQMYVDDCQNP